MTNVEEIKEAVQNSLRNSMNGFVGKIADETYEFENKLKEMLETVHIQI